MVLSLGACAGGPLPGVAERTDTPDGCYLTETLPALIETVTEQDLVTPAILAADGSIETPAIYQSRSRQAIVRERQEARIETLCDAQMTPELVSSLQRALNVRRYYKGPVTGIYDPATKAAVRHYQTTLGLPSAVLSVETARQLGLVAVPREDTGTG